VATVAKKSTAKPAAATAKKTAAKAAAPVAEKPKAKPASKPAPVKTAAAPAKKAAAMPAAKTPEAGKKSETAKPAAKAPASSKPAAPAKAAELGKKHAAKPVAKKPALKAHTGLLSEAELLKMSDQDYMNEAQQAFFRARLQSMKDDILENARETGEHLKENEVFADPNDRATVEEENMLEQRVRDRERKLLKKIDSALRRLDAGEYGFCLETGEPIGIGRLLARPTAELSIEAQEKHERMEKLFAD
jgi:DnaK suppressor protein